MTKTPEFVTPGSRTEPPLLRECAAEARRCLGEAAKWSIAIPDETVSVLIATERALDAGGITAAQEERFWKAYAYMRTNVFDLRRIRRRYNVGFLGLLLVLLALQSIYISTTSVIDAVKAQWTVVLDYEIGRTDACRDRATARPAEAPAVEAAKAPPAGTAIRQALTLSPDGCPTRPVSEPEYGVALTKLLSYDHLLKTGHALLPWLGSGRDDSAAMPSRDSLRQVHHFISLGALTNTRHFLELFILPALYGALGACAFVLRRFSYEQQQGAILDDSGIRYGLRISIGVIAGLAIHWLIRPAEGADAAHASASVSAALQHLSRYALSFVAGYGSEIVFNILDRLVAALAPGRQTDTTQYRAPAPHVRKRPEPETDETSDAEPSTPKRKARHTVPAPEEEVV
ncbi:MAG TPA: hypothetical protein VD978_29085 [Azospirillum sp.]|nr:hypothetical protein [Azospirillum sp.]